MLECVDESQESATESWDTDSSNSKNEEIISPPSQPEEIVDVNKASIFAIPRCSDINMIINMPSAVLMN